MHSEQRKPSHSEHKVSASTHVGSYREQNTTDVLVLEYKDMYSNITLVYRSFNINVSTQEQIIFLLMLGLQ